MICLLNIQARHFLVTGLDTGTWRLSHAGQVSPLVFLIVSSFACTELNVATSLAFKGCPKFSWHRFAVCIILWGSFSLEKISTAYTINQHIFSFHSLDIPNTQPKSHKRIIWGIFVPIYSFISNDILIFPKIENIFMIMTTYFSHFLNNFHTNRHDASWFLLQFLIDVIFKN